MRVRFLCLLFALALCVPARAADAPAPSAAACILVHPETGRVLYEKNADERLPIASTTKIMTALLVLERRDLRDTVAILPEDVAVEGSSMGLEAGQTRTVEELLWGMMLRSGNDAAAALARDTAGSIEAFAGLMNEKAAALGLRNTHFSNPHGLDAPDHFSTARDLAALACAAMENETFVSVVSAAQKTVGGETYENHNRLLRTYPGAIGVKTGYTQAAGRILVSCAQRGDTRFLCVTIDDADDWNDHTALLDWAFETYRYRLWDDVSFVLPVLSGGSALCVAVPSGPAGLLLRAGEHPRVTAELPRFVFAPLHAGQTLGTLHVSLENGESADAPLVCAQEIPQDPAVRLTFPERLGRFWRLAGRAFFVFHPQE